MTASTTSRNYRLDVLYGVKVVDNRLAVRMGGGASDHALAIRPAITIDRGVSSSSLSI